LKKGVYIRNFEIVQDFLRTDTQCIDSVAIGNYGCTKAVPSADKIITLAKKLDNQNISVHYISPKVTQSNFEEEYNRIEELCKSNVTISINDWGLLYRLCSQGENKKSSVYLGRLLSKSLKDWYWSDIFFSRESNSVKNYFYQNSLSQQLKIDLLKEMGISGIEVSIREDSETSYKKITDSGLGIIGYADDIILALSRACPFLRFKTDNIFAEPGCKNCHKPFQAKLHSNGATNNYPDFLVTGNLIAERNTYETKKTYLYNIIFSNLE
jgi:hypothetical protein